MNFLDSKSGSAKQIISVPELISALLATALLSGGGAYAYQKSQSDTAIAVLQSEINSLQNQSIYSTASSPVAKPVSDTTKAPVATLSSSPSTDPYLYTNAKYEFTMQLNSKWEGYKVTQQTITASDSAGIDKYRFYLPTTDMNLVADSADTKGYANALIVSIYPLSVWKRTQAESGPKPALVAQNSKYVAAIETWQNPPRDLADKFGTEIPLVAKSLVFTQN